jgi:hypothetical protein
MTETPMACSDLRTFSAVQPVPRWRLPAALTPSVCSSVLVGVLVVHHEQAALAGGIERKEVHAVVVHAGLHGLVVGAVAGVGRKGGHAAGHAGGGAPGVEQLPFVFGRNHDAVVQRRGHAGEAEHIDARCLPGVGRGWRRSPWPNSATTAAAEPD